jgi:hypothetical protein
MYRTQKSGIPSFFGFQKKCIVTNRELFFWWPYANFPLWSQLRFFTKVLGLFSKLDIKNVQKRKAKNTFGKNIAKFAN